MKTFENDSYLSFLKQYYNKENDATRYGIERFEIRHSNFLAWLFNPEKAHGLNTLPIRKLLEFLQVINPEDTIDIKHVKVNRETIYNIDIFIELTLKEHDVHTITIENKLDSLLSDGQLEKYKNKIDETYKIKENNHFIYLHPSYNDESTNAIHSGFKSMTYQELYDNILIDIKDLIVDLESRSALYNYIHALSLPYGEDNSFAIITKEEKYCIKKFCDNNKDILTKLACSMAKRKFKSYTDEELLFNKIFVKYLNIPNYIKGETIDKTLGAYIKKITNKYAFVYNDSTYAYNSFVKMLYSIFDILVNEQHKNYDELKELIEIYGDNDKIIASTYELSLNDMKYSFDKYSQKYFVVFDGEKYYMFDYWNYKLDYEVFKNKFEKLKDKIYKDFKII